MARAISFVILHIFLQWKNIRQKNVYFRFNSSFCPTNNTSFIHQNIDDIHISINVYKLQQMGNQSCSLPNIISKDFELPDLKARSSYGVLNDMPKQDQADIIKSIFHQSYDANRRSKIVENIQANNNRFEDEKFKIDTKDNSRLSVLYNFQNMKMRVFTTKTDTDKFDFTQLNIEFAYLTSVYYLLCKREIKATLLRSIIQTQQTNLYGAYSVNFFNNGQKHSVVVDDIVPTHKDSFVYCRLIKGAELWPLILEKAWCKQVGSYKRALGLSPQDAFEQITGIPSYTYKLKSTNRPFIKNLLQQAISKQYWVTLIACSKLEDLQSRQVFYLNAITTQRKYNLISPFSNFSFEGAKPKRRGQVEVSQQDIFTHFEYVVVGFYKKDYKSISEKVQSLSHEQVVFQINVKRRQQISIRFNQLYDAYLGDEQKFNYRYSPILMQLYKINDDGEQTSYSLVNQCQGCKRSLAGARSSHFADNIFQELEGRYLLRMEIDWQHEKLLNSGHLVVYSTEGNVSISRQKNSQIMLKQVYPSIFTNINKKSEVQIYPQYQLQLKTFNKIYSTLFSFKNVSKASQKFDIELVKANNIMIRGGKVNGIKTTIDMLGQATTVIEVLPKNASEESQFENINIIKVDQK